MPFLRKNKTTRYLHRIVKRCNLKAIMLEKPITIVEVSHGFFLEEAWLHNRNQCLVVNCMLWNVIQPGVVSNLTSFYWNKLGDWQTGYYNRRPIINFTFELMAKPQWPWEFVSPERPRFKQTLPASTSNVLCLFVTKSARLLTAAKQLTRLVKWSVVIPFLTLQINYNIFEKLPEFFIWGQ